MVLVGFVLFVGACVGHVSLLAFSLNWWYGHAISRRILSKVRLAHGLAVVAGPPLFAWWLGFNLAWPVASSRSWWESVGWAYVLTCSTIGLVLVPWITWARWRHRPALLVHQETRTIDVAQALGYKPIGNGRHALMARLPGNGIFRVDFAEKVLRIPNLPAVWDGLALLHVSDLHLGGTPDRTFYEHVLDRCLDWPVDLVAFTGDMVDTYDHHRWILRLLGRLRGRYGAYAILGNHDSWYDPGPVRRRLRRAHFHVLGNSWTQIQIEGERLILIGNEAPWFKPAPDLSSCPTTGFRLCLSHTPDNIRWAQQHGVELMLAGHNHGGQIRFPVIGSVLVPSRYGRRYDCGVFEEKPTVLHVSRGLVGQHPVRYNCHPEVTRLVLRTTPVQREDDGRSSNHQLQI